ncbi:Alpha/Beta hydrolase protein [Microdochium trichocladiopsis]|uniref:Alpha/Beta hydrolase protein n=1 Tax=Microdochium trichocladiopsis TaxID=1682393 RepID=A0A9P9BSY0_9PEZI|nr:Alpha/Beta hydrolase protein [Microdochium trichocladiopsis]KAH7034922.1 Alpha/Beta hydrolase protein [Microdochium trichocladiopsis]
MAPLRLDPELAAVMAALAPAGGADSQSPFPAVPTVASFRQSFKDSFEQVCSTIEWPAGMQTSTHTTTSLDGSTLEITRFLPANAGPARAVLYVFGGGTIAGSVEQSRNLIARTAAATSTQHFGVHYRLAPEHPYPAALEDVYSGLVWLQAHAAEFGVDPARLVIAGASAGGLLSAAAALYARDHKLDHPIAGMLLRYPMLDDRTVLAEGDALKPFLAYTTESNDLAWACYLGRPRSERGDDNVPIYAAPGRATDLSNLPRAYVDVGGLDLFRDESLAFASRLAAANEDVEFHLFPGVIHGFDFMAMLSVSKAAAAAEYRFIESF